MNQLVEEKIEHSFLANLTKAEGVLPSSLQDAAQEIINTTPVPTTKVEDWKYTRVAKIAKKNYTKGSIDLTSVDTFKIHEGAHHVVLVNGQLNTDLSTALAIDGVSIKSFSNCSAEELNFAGRSLENGSLFEAINTAYAQDGIAIFIAPKATIETPIEITHVLTGAETIALPRLLVVAEKSSNASITQTFFSENTTDSFTNQITEVIVKENASLTLDKLQYESQDNYHIGTDEIYQEANSRFTINTLTLNGGLVRNNLHIVVEGQNCESNLNGVYLTNGKQHVDNHTIVDHKVAHCESNELYKGIMDDQSTGVFNGKVFVRKDAQKINAFQSNDNVLLSDDASINSKPELEIYADDVKCSHGSTTGQLDEEAVFYLRARGLSEKSARQLMVTAFVGDVFEKVENEALMTYVNQCLSDRFGWDFE